MKSVCIDLPTVVRMRVASCTYQITTCSVWPSIVLVNSIPSRVQCLVITLINSIPLCVHVWWEVWWETWSTRPTVHVMLGGSLFAAPRTTTKKHHKSHTTATICTVPTQQKYAGLFPLDLFWQTSPDENWKNRKGMINLPFGYSHHSHIVSQAHLSNPIHSGNNISILPIIRFDSTQLENVHT